MEVMDLNYSIYERISSSEKMKTGKNVVERVLVENNPGKTS